MSELDFVLFVLRLELRGLVCDCKRGCGLFLLLL
jgi:hypothetical protein